MRSVGALIFPGFELLDLFGPLEMLGLMKDEFELHLVAERRGAVPSSQGVSASADVSTTERSHFDILLVPGGAGTRNEVNNPDVLNWVSGVAANAELVLGVCTGSAILARAGLLDGREATTNKAAFAWVAEQGPNVRWRRRARWVEDGLFVTSSGVSAGMDMTLAVIARLHGMDIARKVAEVCEYQWHDDATWDPFAEVHGMV